MESTKVCDYWKWRDKAQAKGAFDPADTRSWDVDFSRSAPAPCRNCPRCRERASNSTEPLRPRKTVR